MVTRDAFLEAIIAAPEDDTPRLIFADWLEEHGEPERAEFIRVQCKLACDNLPACYHNWPKFSCRRCELIIKERLLLTPFGNINDPYSPKKPRPEWAGFLAQIFASINWNSKWFFHRGFITEITCNCTDWLRHGAKLLQATPLEEVTFTDYWSYIGDAIWRRDRELSRHFSNDEWWMFWERPKPVSVYRGERLRPQGALPGINWFAIHTDRYPISTDEMNWILDRNPNTPEPRGLISHPTRRGRNSRSD